MEIDSFPINAEETEQIGSFDATRPFDLVPDVSASALEEGALEEGQIPSRDSSPPQPPSEKGVATPQALDKGKAKAVEDDWAMPRQVTAVIMADQDRGDDWDSGSCNNDRVASLTVPRVTATTTMKTTNNASVNSVQETPQAPQSVAEKSISKGWGSWGMNDGWESPVPAGRAANDGWRSPVPARVAGEWGAVPSPAAGPAPLSTTTAATASTSTWDGTSGWNSKTTNRVRFEDRSERDFERGKARGRGRGRDRDWGNLSGFGKRDDPYSRDQPPTKSFNQPSTSFSNPDSGWGARSGRHNWTNETSTTRKHQQEQSTRSAWGTNIPPPPIYQTQPPMGLHGYHSPLDPSPFQPLASPVTTLPVLWPLHTDLTLKREFSHHANKLAKYQVRLTGVENKQQGVLNWYNLRAKDLSDLHADDRKTLEQELNKTRLKRDNNLAVLKVDEKKYTGLVEVEWALVVRTLREEMARVLENAVHELLWKMTAVSGDGRGGVDINRALEEIVKTAMPSIIEGLLQRYEGTIMKAAEKECRKVQAGTPVEDHPMKEQPGTGQVSSSDLQVILDRLSALEQANVDLKASNTKLQEVIHQLEAKTQDGISSVRKEAMGWSLEGEAHPVAQQIREKIQTEREFILEGITSNLQSVFGAVLDRRSPDV